MKQFVQLLKIALPWLYWCSLETEMNQEWISIIYKEKMHFDFYRKFGKVKVDYMQQTTTMTFIYIRVFLHCVTATFTSVKYLLLLTQHFYLSTLLQWTYCGFFFFFLLVRLWVKFYCGTICRWQHLFPFKGVQRLPVWFQISIWVFGS